MSEVEKLHAGKFADNIELRAYVYMVGGAAEVQLHSNFNDTYSYSELKQIVDGLGELLSRIDAYRWRIENEQR